MVPDGNDFVALLRRASFPHNNELLVPKYFMSLLDQDSL